ncbi:hypothetical protein BKA66DRAFT_406177 [Pyrenochaeta sp. MPI-SDFR-AT-0127]|nr:hypothetical protein BKA66DRAFT_406177 [Pyrenochaeta sp. MPI-SDFR-AT-0127]
MASLLKWWFASSKPTTPERIPTDTVIPLNRYDDSRANRNISIGFTMQFDSVLDAERLSSALWTLLERPGWRKLGARLRLNESDKLEYHIPAQYTKDRPPINYTHESHDMSLSQHPIGAKFPRANGSLQVIGDLEPLRDITIPKNNTTVLADWIYTDKAQLGLHIVNFTDATLVTLTWMHTLLDAMGRHALLKAWTAVLDGREDDVPEFWGYDFDPLEKLGAPGVRQAASATESAKEDEFVLKDQQVKGWNLYKFIFNHKCESFFYPNEETRILVMPASYFATLKKRALQDLESADTSLLTMSFKDPKNPKPFISDGDILCAWLTRLMASSNPSILASPGSRTIHILNAFGMRDLLSNTAPQLIPRGTAYIGNCVSAMHTFLSQQDFLSLPLGHLAAHFRRDLVLQGTRAQVEANQALAKANGGQQILYGDGDMAMMVFSNWLKAKFFDTDFSPAIVKDGGKGAGKGKPVYIHVHGTIGKGAAVRGTGSCVGKDAEGNLWLGAVLRKECVEGFVKAVEGMR